MICTFDGRNLVGQELIQSVKVQETIVFACVVRGCYAVASVNCLRIRRSTIENKLLSFAARSQDTYHCFSVFFANLCAIITALLLAAVLVAL